MSSESDLETRLRRDARLALREMYPTLSDEELEPIVTTLLRYVVLTDSIWTAAQEDPSRREVLAERLNHHGFALPRQPSQPPTAGPVPLARVVAETRVARTAASAFFFARPALVYETALPPEKRELLLVLTTEHIVSQKNLTITLARPFEVIEKVCDLLRPSAERPASLLREAEEVDATHGERRI